MLGFFGEQVPVRSGVDDLGFDLPPHHATGLIDFFDRHQHDIAQGHFADGHRAAQGVQHADFNGWSAGRIGERIVAQVSQERGYADSGRDAPTLSQKFSSR